MSTLPVTLPPLDQQTRQQLLAQEAQRGGLLPLTLPVPQQAQPAAAPVQAQPAQPVDPLAEVQRMQAYRQQQEQSLPALEQQVAQAREQEQQARQQLQQYMQQAAEKPPEMPTTFRKPKWWELALGMGMGALAGAYGTDTPLGQAGLIAGSAMAHRNQIEAMRQWQAQFANWSLRHKQALEMVPLVMRQEELSQRDIEYAQSLLNHTRDELLRTTQALYEMNVNTVSPELAQSMNSPVVELYRIAGIDPKQAVLVRPGMSMAQAQMVVESAHRAASAALQLKEFKLRQQQLALQREELRTMREAQFTTSLDKELDQINKTLKPMSPSQLGFLESFARAENPTKENAIEVVEVLINTLRDAAGGRFMKTEMENLRKALGVQTNLEIFLNRVLNRDDTALNVLGRPQNILALQRIVRTIVDLQRATQSALSLISTAKNELIRQGRYTEAAALVGAASRRLSDPDAQRVLIGRDRNGEFAVTYYYDLGVPELTNAALAAAVNRLRARGVPVDPNNPDTLRTLRTASADEAPEVLEQLRQVDQAAKNRSALPSQVPPRTGFRLGVSNPFGPGPFR